MKSTKKKLKINIYDLMVYGFLLICMITTLFPFLNVLATSLSPYEDYLQRPMMIIPSNITFDTYKLVLSNNLLYSSYFNTIVITVLSSLLSIILTILTAYPLSMPGLKGRKLIVTFLLITMIFNGGLVPNFILIKNLGLYNSLAALIIPGCLGAWSIFIMQSFMRNIPESLRESAIIDGASEPRVLFQIIVPLIIPAVAFLVLTHAVVRWNQFFNALIYIRDRDKWPLQLLLREILLQGNTAFSSESGNFDMELYFTNFNIKTANIIITILPIICVYPFLQKYFVKGAVLGAVKG